MNDVISKVKEKYPAYRDVPDDQLTVLIGDKYPQYLSNAQFKEDYERVKSPARKPEPVAPFVPYSSSRGPVPPELAAQYPLSAEDPSLAKLPIAVLAEPLPALSTPLARVAKKAVDVAAGIGYREGEKAVFGVSGTDKPPTIEEIAASPEASKATRIGAGAIASIADTADFFTSPLGISTLGIGALPAAVQRTIAIAFAVQMGKQVPEIARQLGEELGKPENQRDYGKIGNLITSGATATGFAALAGAHGLGPEAQPAAPSKIPVEWRTVAPRTAQALEQQTKTGETYASSISKTAEVHGDVRPQPTQGVGEVPVEGGGSGVQPQAAGGIREQAPAPAQQEPPVPIAREAELEAKSKSGTLTTDEAAELADIRMASKPAETAPSPAVADFTKAIEDPNFKGGNKTSTAAGMGAKSISDLDALAALRKKYAASTEDQGLRSQLAKEAIEVATNTGAWAESEMKDPFKPLGERPLDWQKNPAVADWLRENAEGLGIVLPEEAKAGPGAKTVGETPRPKVPEVSEQYKEKVLKQYKESKTTPTNKQNFLSKWNKFISEKIIRGALPESSLGKPIVEVVRTTVLRGSGESTSYYPTVTIREDGRQVWRGPASDFEYAKPLKIIYGDKLISAGKSRSSDIYVLGEQAPPLGPGAKTIGEPEKAELAQLTDAAKTLAEQATQKPEVTKAYSLGEKLSHLKDAASTAMSGLKTAALYQKAKLLTPAIWNDFKSALGRRQLALTDSVFNARKFADTMTRAVPQYLDRVGISNWLDHGGDKASLQKALAEAPALSKAGYERALNLTPEQVTLAENIRNYFGERLQDAIDAGILEDGVENYIHRVYEKDTPWKQGVIAELRAGVFTGRPQFAKERVFKLDVDAEKAGYRPEKDFVKRVAQYDLALNKAIADRQMVREIIGGKDPQGNDVKGWKLPDGKPALQFLGTASKVGTEGVDATFLVRPSGGKTTPQGETRYVTADGRPYVPFDHPALKKWKWVEEDAAGSPIMVQGEALVHPDALKEIKAVFGQSKVRQYRAGRAALATSATIKQTMLDLSGFHPVQITVHGWEHRADVPFARWTAKVTGRTFKEINLEDPTQRALISHGLVVADPYHYEIFGEGLSGSSLTKHLPFGIGEKLQQYNHWLFQDYIPRLKMEMATHALERNRAAYSKELAAKTMTEDQLLHMTANQANAAFGEMNYEMLGRSKTVQDMLRLGLLAPDFLEARARFAGQAGKSLVGGYGREQLVALGLGALTLYMTARLLNRATTGQWHLEPEHAFDVLHNGRAYSLRTVQGDILHAIFNPRSFAYTRLNPVTTRTAFELLTGRDQFGRPRSAVQQLKDFASVPVPISLRGLFRGQEQKLWESFLNAFGITERRATASDTIFKLADTWKKAHNIGEPGEFIYDPEKDPYRDIKLALMFGNPKTAAQEIKLAIDGGMTYKKVNDYLLHYGTRPFTGSHANDTKFKQELSADQKKTYDDALKERAKVRAAAREALKLYRQDLTPEKAKAD